MRQLLLLPRAAPHSHRNAAGGVWSAPRPASARWEPLAPASSWTNRRRPLRGLPEPERAPRVPSRRWELPAGAARPRAPSYLPHAGAVG